MLGRGFLGGELVTMEANREQLEEIYEALADAIDAVGGRRETMFLSKLALAMGHHIGDPDTVAALIAVAQRDLD